MRTADRIVTQFSAFYPDRSTTAGINSLYPLLPRMLAFVVLGSFYNATVLGRTRTLEVKGEEMLEQRSI